MSVVEPCFKMPLSEQYFMLVSEIDRPLAESSVWRVTSTKKKYARGFVGGERHLFHRIVMGLRAGDPETVDHINGNSLDNRRENLRICSAQQNSWNRKVTHSRLGLFGVSLDKSSGAYIARFTHDGKAEYLGCFDTPVEAAHAYNKRAHKLRGEFAALNPINREQLDAALKERINKLQAEIDLLSKEIT